MRVDVDKTNCSYKLTVKNRENFKKQKYPGDSRVFICENVANSTSTIQGRQRWFPGRYSPQ